MGLLAPRKSLADDVDANGYWRPAPWGGGLSSWSRLVGDVTAERGLTLSAVWAATRILTETFATLPAGVIQTLGERRKKATGHRLWRAIAVQPNPEQSSYVWRVQMEEFRLNGGNAFAEIQEDTEGRVWLWPIHPSRIPPENIVRNNRRNRETAVGEPGELVYYVNNNNGTKTPIPKSRILHVPGVLPANGLYGKSIISAGAASLGIALAQEQSVETFHGNGMTSRIVLRHPGKLSPEKAAELRSQWQQIYGSPGKGYKAVVLEQGMEVDTLTISPGDAQLLESRKFGVLEVARWYRLPPHKLAELGRATWSNIENQNTEFIEDAILPIVTCWEQELARQLLRDDEQGEYSVKYNLRGRMRADSATRKDYYSSLFGMGTMSRNEIRALEDLDPVPGGDNYYIANNNYAPLAADGTPILPEPEPAAPPAEPADEPTEQAAFDLGAVAERNRAKESALRATCREMVRAAWSDVIAFEVRSVRRAAEKPGQFPTWAAEFYGEGGGFLKAAAAKVTLYGAAVKGFGGAFGRTPMEYGFASLSRLESLYDVKQDGFAAAVAAEVDSWPSRADQFAADVLGDAE